MALFGELSWHGRRLSAIHQLLLTQARSVPRVFELDGQVRLAPESGRIFGQKGTEGCQSKAGPC